METGLPWILEIMETMSSEWFLAELVIEINVAGDQRNVVHENLVLIRASSAEEAYEKALQIGKRAETSYRNVKGSLVQIFFRGISDLDAIYDDLEDGAELMFRYRVDVPTEEIRSLVRPKNKLRAFVPPRRAEGPDYASAEVISEVERQFKIKRPPDD